MSILSHPGNGISKKQAEKKGKIRVTGLIFEKFLGDVSPLFQVPSGGELGF